MSQDFETNNRQFNELLKRLFRNSSILFSGNLWVSIFGLASFALTAKALGTEQFGLLVLVTTYVLLIDKLVNFQAWRALIKFGSDSLNSKSQSDFKALVKMCSIIDMFSALLATCVAIIGVYLVGRSMEWSDDIINTIISYSFVLLFRVSGTPSAVLRIYDKFKAFVIRGIISSSIKLLGVACAYYLDGGLAEFLFVWAVTDVVGQLLLYTAGWRELKAQGHYNVFHENIRKITESHPGFWRFVWVMGFDSTVYVGREADVYIIGALLSLEEVALYKIGKQIALVLLKIIDPVYTAIYPELAKLRAPGKSKQFMMLIKKSSLIMGGMMMIPLFAFVLFGDFLIITVFGEEYGASFAPAVFCVLSMVVWGFSQPLSPALLSMDKPKVTFLIHLTTTILYVFLLNILLPVYGVVGAGIAYFVFYLLWSLLMLLAFTYFVKPQQYNEYSK